MKSILNIPSESGVYIIENTSTGQAYIGSSSNMRKRCNAHRCLLENGKHTNIKLQRSYKKYGESKFSIRTLECTLPEEIIQAEQGWVDRLRPFFNIRPVVESSRGVKLSEETRIKMSLAQKGKPISKAKADVLHMLHQNRVGVPVAGKVKEALRLGPLSRIGKPVSEETRRKIGEARKGKKWNKETRTYE